MFSSALSVHSFRYLPRVGNYGPLAKESFDDRQSDASREKLVVHYSLDPFLHVAFLRRKYSVTYSYFPTSVSIAEPGGLSLAPKSTQQFTAVGTYTDGSSKDLTNTAAWSSTSNATIVAGGLATAVNPGNATITAASH